MDDQISNFLSTRIEAGDFPSATYFVSEKGEVKLSGTIGNAVVEPQLIPAREDTIYDLASLTKPLITGLITAMMIERGQFSLDYRVATLLSEFEVEGKRTITVQNLLTHT